MKVSCGSLLLNIYLCLWWAIVPFMLLFELVSVHRLLVSDRCQSHDAFTVKVFAGPGICPHTVGYVVLDSRTKGNPQYNPRGSLRTYSRIQSNSYESSGKLGSPTRRLSQGVDLATDSEVTNSIIHASGVIVIGNDVTGSDRVFLVYSSQTISVRSGLNKLDHAVPAGWCWRTCA